MLRMLAFLLLAFVTLSAQKVPTPLTDTMRKFEESPNRMMRITVHGADGKRHLFVTGITYNAKVPGRLTIMSETDGKTTVEEYAIDGYNVELIP